MHRLDALLASALLIALAAPAHSRSCKDCAKPAADLTIDLASGNISGSTAVAVSRSVVIRFENRNPLRTYEIKIDSTPAAEPAYDYLSKIFSFAAKPLGLEQPQATAAASPTPGATGARTGQVNASTTGQTQRVKAAGEAARNQEQQLSTCQHTYETVKNALDAHKKEKIAPALEEAEKAQGAVERAVTKLQDSAHGLRARLSRRDETCDSFTRDRKPGIDDLKEALEILRTAVGELETKAKDAKAAIAHSVPDDSQRKLIEDSCRSLSEQLLAPLSSATEYAASASKLDAALQKASRYPADAEADIKALEDAQCELVSYTRGPFLDPTQVQISVRSKGPDDPALPDKPEIQTTLHFGGRQRFALALGVAFSTLDTDSFTVNKGVVRNADGTELLDNGQPRIADIIDRTDGSRSRVTPLILLHTRFLALPQISGGLHASLGVSGKVSDGGTDIEYLAGVSLSLAEERFFLTIGAYNGRVQRLRPGFYSGQPVNASDFKDAPVIKERQWKPGFSLTYRIY